MAALGLDWVGPQICQDASLEEAKRVASLLAPQRDRRHQPCVGEAGGFGWSEGGGQDR